MEVHALLLELEGIVVDTREPRQLALAEALQAERVHLPTHDSEEGEGVPPRDAALALLSESGVLVDDTALDLIALRAERAFVERISAGITLCEGALELITSAEGRARLGLVTRARRDEADIMLRLAGLDDAFEVVVTADDALDAKPSPEIYRLALGRLSKRRALAPARTIAIEDAAWGVRSAKRAGLRCIAVGGLPVHSAMEADAYVPSLAGHTLDSLARLSRPSIDGPFQDSEDDAR